MSESKKVQTNREGIIRSKNEMVERKIVTKIGWGEGYFVRQCVPLRVSKSGWNSQNFRKNVSQKFQKFRSLSLRVSETGTLTVLKKVWTNLVAFWGKKCQNQPEFLDFFLELQNWPPLDRNFLLFRNFWKFQWFRFWFCESFQNIKIFLKFFWMSRNPKDRVSWKAKNFRPRHCLSIFFNW